MDNEMYDKMDRIVTMIKKLEDIQIGLPAKRRTDEEEKELEELTAKLQELKQKDDKAVGL
jgi:hypothetical protein